MKRMTRFLFWALTILCLCGCSKEDGELATQKEVLKKVSSAVPNEKYTLVSVEHNEDVLPKVDTYTFQSKERDLTFTAVSTLSEIWIDGGTGWYSKSIRVDYEQKVAEYYREEIQTILAPIRTDKSGASYCTSYEEITEIAELVCKADAVYAAERKYNTAEWMAENPYGGFCLYYLNENDPDARRVTIASVTMDGTLACDTVVDYFRFSYAQAASEGKLSDDSIPEAQMNRTVVRNLSVWLGEENLSKKSNENDKGLNNRVDAAYRTSYYYDWEDYAIPLDVALTDGTYAPLWMRTYADALGFEINVETDKGKIQWTYQGSRYVMTAKKDSDRRVASFQITKDGKRLDLPYIVHGETRSPINCTYVVGIRAQDFAKLFNLSITIDKEEARLIFTKNE